MTDIVVVGTGGFAREVHQLLEDSVADGQRWNVLGFLDDDLANAGEAVHGLPVLGGCSWLSRRSVSVALGIGSPASRWRVVAKILEQAPECSFPTLVHPTALVGNRIDLGDGAIICAGSLLTTDLSIGAHVILNLDCTVGHDTRVGDFVTAAPSVNVSGNVLVGEGSDLGTGTTIIQGVEIGAWSIIGAGAVVVRDIPANVTAVGVPAEPIKERSAGWHLG